jgi:hypothetical protein
MSGAMDMFSPGANQYMRTLDYAKSGHPYANMAGDALALGGSVAAGEAIPKMSAAVRESALGGQAGADAAALRTLRVPASSTKAVRTLDAVQGARPFLQGMNSVEDAQTRIPAAKSEIWAPYEQTVKAIGDRPLRGPDGMSTVRALEDERTQLSALNRGLKNGDPASLQLAQQKGMTQAQLLDREQAVQQALDPELQKAGIQPREIRKAFGQVSQVGSKLMGRSTLAEEAQPYGLGRMTNVRLDNPSTWLGEPIQGFRDVFAGRPWWSGKLSDVELGEAFRSGGPKPDFGQLRPQTRLQLPSSVPLREGEFSGEWNSGMPNESQVTPAPRSLMALPAKAGEGEVQPMAWERAPSHPVMAPEFSRQRIRPNEFSMPSEGRPVGGSVTPMGEVIPRPRGYLPGVFASIEPPEEPGMRIWPRGSEFQGEEEPQVHPHGSARMAVRKVLKRSE